MTDRLSLTVKSLFDWTFVSTLDLSNVRDSTQFASTVNFEDGNGLDECNQLFHDTRSLAGGASEDINLLAVTVSMFGGTITFGFDIVKAILIRNNSTTANDTLLVGGQGSNAFSAPFNNDDDAVLQVPPGGSICLLNPSVAGWDVAAGAYALRVTNSGPSSNTYSIAVAGVLLES